MPVALLLPNREPHPFRMAPLRQIYVDCAILYTCSCLPRRTRVGHRLYTACPGHVFGGAVPSCRYYTNGTVKSPSLGQCAGRCDLLLYSRVCSLALRSGSGAGPEPALTQLDLHGKGQLIGWLESLVFKVTIMNQPICAYSTV